MLNYQRVIGFINQLRSVKWGHCPQFPHIPTHEGRGPLKHQLIWLIHINPPSLLLKTSRKTHGSCTFIDFIDDFHWCSLIFPSIKSRNLHCSQHFCRYSAHLVGTGGRQRHGGRLSQCVADLAQPLIAPDWEKATISRSCKIVMYVIPHPSKKDRNVIYNNLSLFFSSIFSVSLSLSPSLSLYLSLWGLL